MVEFQSKKNQAEVTRLAGELHRIIFEPEVAAPVKTLDLPLGGSSSPVDALSILLDYLTIANGVDPTLVEGVSREADDETGDRTIEILKGGYKIARRITGNSAESLGLHPAVYFTNDKGKHSRFLFLGIVALIAEKIKNNDGGWFREFTLSREKIERFLIDNKSVIGIVLQNLGKKARIPKMRDMFDFLVKEIRSNEVIPGAARVFEHLGLSGKIYDLTALHMESSFTDETRSQIFFRQALQHAQQCPVCRGLLDSTKSVSYDHIVPLRDGGLGNAENGQMVHPYCNSAMKG